MKNSVEIPTACPRRVFVSFLEHAVYYAYEYLYGTRVYLD